MSDRRITGSLDTFDTDEQVCIGQINFSNTLPLVVPFQNGLVRLPARWHFDTPSRLNALLEKRILHVSAMSSFYYLASGRFRLMPGVSISCRGQVGSVILVLRRGIDDLSERIIEVPEASATSTNLLRVLYLEAFGHHLKLAPVSSPAPESTGAALLMGDDALVRCPRYGNGWEQIDLGEWWYGRYRLPMVFGVWGARIEWIEARRELFEEVGTALRAARDLGLSGCLDQVVQEGVHRTGLHAEILYAYFSQQLDYQLSEQHLQGLSLYADLCKRHNLLSFEAASADSAVDAPGGFLTGQSGEKQPGMAIDHAGAR